MSGFVPYAFTDAQCVDIRRFCGYPARADGNVLFPAPWVNIQYLALEYRLQHMSQSEGAVLVTYLTTLNALELAVVGAGANLDTDQAAVWKHNKTEVADRMQLFDAWRRRLCAFMGITPGPAFVTSGGGVGCLGMVV
jgi:hypothetical protein